VVFPKLRLINQFDGNQALVLSVGFGDNSIGVLTTQAAAYIQNR